MGAGVSWGETTTLLEHGTNAAPWTAERLATWTNVGATLTFDSESTPTYVQYSQSPRGAFSSTQTISPTTNAIINVEAVWRARSNTGRFFSQPCGIYFRFGNIVVAQNDQDQKHGYTFSGLTDMKNVTTFTAGSYRKDISECTWLKISMDINTATNTLTSFSVKSEDGNTTYASASNVALSNPDYTTVSFGWIDADAKNEKQEQLKSVKITQTTQDVVVSGYTIKFQDASGNTLKDDITSRTGVVGTVIPITDSDKADFYTGEGDNRKKWKYASDDSGEDANKIAEDGSTVVIVKFSEVAKYSYSATTKAEETVLPYSYAGSQFKDETVKIPYPRYQLQSGILYTKAATSNEYNYSFTLDSDNQEETITGYSDSEIKDVVFYTEGEDIAGATRHTSTGVISSRSSASAVGTSDGALTIMNGLPAGKYKIVAAFYKNSSANVSTSFTVGSTVVNVSTNTTLTNLQEVTSDEFVVSSTSDVVWAGTGFLDYVYIQKTGDVTVPVSGLADGEYVYTPQGRFQITGDVIARSNFDDFSGWEVITAIDDKKVVDNFAIDPENGPAAGVLCAVSLDDTAGEGMYFKFTPTDAGATYVVSYKMKGAQAVTTRVKTVAVSTNLVKVEGNSDGVYGGTNDVLLCNTAEELSDEWQTFNYAIVGDGIPRTYFISFSGMASNIYIADLQIAEAYQVADLRARDAALERVNVYKNAYAWSEEDLNDYGIYDALEILNAIGDQSSQAALNDALDVANEMLNEFRYSNMDDYLAGGDERNYLSNTFEVAGDSEASSYGVWNCIPSGRGHWAANAYPDMGHYPNGTTWNNGAPTTAQGVTTQMELTPGSYVFAIKSAAALREPLEQTWHTDDGMKPAYGIAYIAKVNGETVDIIASSEQKDLEPVKMTPFYVTANITEAGKYEFGMLAYCKEAYQSLELGSVTYVGDASIVGKSYSKYTQKQLAYEEDVREQITTGRNQLTIAAANLADEEKLWGKDELQACVDTVAPRIAAYETLTQDDIIATYEDYYEKTISNDNGIMVYGVYHFAVKDIIAANRRFYAVNATVPVTITSAGWATLYTPYAIDFSTVEGLEAYTVTVSENTVTLTKVNNVPAGTGVVLKGEAKDYNIPVTAHSETEKGSLEGSATEATAYDAFSGYKLYMLKKVGDNVQFVPMTSGSLAKGKAYLKIAQDNAGSGEAKALSVVFVNEPTGIKSVNSDETKVNGIYDLQGRRVSQPTKGLYIVNGKKVVIK